MSLPAAPAMVGAVSRSDPRTGRLKTPETRLRGGWLLFGRVTWVVLVAGTLGLFAVAVPARLDQLRELDIQANTALRQSALAGAPSLVKALFAAHIYPGVALTVELALTAVFILAALAIFWRRSDDRLAIFASITLVSFAALSAPALNALAAAHPVSQLPVSLVQGIGLECELLIFYLSPDGRFMPDWTRLLAVVWTLWRVAALIFAAAHITFIIPQPYAFATSLSPAVIFWFLAWVGWIGSALFAQIYRYRFASSPAQRQQTKWALIGATAAALGYVAFVLPRIVVPFLGRPGLPDLLYRLIGTPLYLTCLLLVPICVAFSILRYRLWDVDVFINRALVYGSLTATLALIYFAGVLLLGQLLRAVTGQSSNVVVVVSTLAIAALFTPLQHRIQAFIDRRFYRSKYDAARTLASFSATLRHELDLTQLSEGLMAVVEETMQPAHISLWLRQPQREGKLWIEEGGERWRAIPPPDDDGSGAGRPTSIRERGTVRDGS